jgi:hypothetical protein
MMRAASAFASIASNVGGIGTILGSLPYRWPSMTRASMIEVLELTSTARVLI